MTIFLPSKSPNSVEPYYIIWCDEDGTNTGAAADDGILQGATISTVTWTVPAGITEDSHSQAAVTIHGITYGVNTVCTIWLSGGTNGVDYALLCHITTSDGRTLEQTLTIPVRLGADATSALWTTYTVARPAAFTYVVPFTITRQGDYYAPQSWDVSTLAPVGAGKTYYVSKTGDNSDGLTWAKAFSSIESAIAAADVDIIQIGAGVYGWTTGGWRTSNPTRSMSIYGTGTVVITSARKGLTWALDTGGGRANTYKAALNLDVGGVWDGRTPDSAGDYTALTYRASADLVQANPGSYYFDYTSIWVRHTDSGTVDDDTWVVLNLPNAGIGRDGITIYLQNLSFYGGANGAFYPRNASAAGGSKIYAKNCIFKYCVLSGVASEGMNEIILQGCTAARNASDGFNYQERNGVASDIIEINCIGRNNGVVANSANGSSAHGASRVCRLMGTYYANAGPNVVDVDTTLSWDLGSEAYGSLSSGADSTRNNFQSLNLMWLDGINSHDSLFDLVNASGDTIYYHNIRTGGTNEISGSLTAY